MKSRPEFGNKKKCTVSVKAPVVFKMEKSRIAKQFEKKKKY
jgi:hypothetical protein